MDLAYNISHLFRQKRKQNNPAINWHDKYMALFDNTPDPVLEIEGNRICYYNKAASEILKLSPETEYNTEDIFSEFQLKDIDRKDALRLRNTNGEIPIIDFIKLSDSSLIIEFAGSLKSQGKNSVSELVSLKQTLEKTPVVRYSETLLELILKAVPMAYYSYAPENKAKTIKFSPQIAQLSGFALDEFKKKPELWASRIHNNDRQKVEESFDNMTSGRAITSEYRWIDATGHIKWILDQATMILPENKGTNSVIGCLLDISDRKEAEISIRENEQNYREIFNSSADAIFVHNAFTGAVEDVNDTMLKMFGVTYEEALSAPASKLSQNEKPYDDEAAHQHIKTAFDTGTDHFEWISSKKDGTLFWTDIILKRITLNGEPKILALVRNINDKKCAEQQIRYRQEFEKLILNISSSFVSGAYDDIDKIFTAALKQVCDFTKTDAGYIFMYDEEKTPRLIYLWNSQKLSVIRKRLMNISADITAWHTKQILDNRIIKYDTITKIPEKGLKFKTFLNDQNIGAFVDVPQLYQGKIIGYLGLAVAEANRMWTEDETSLIKAVGQSLVNALKRKESVEALSKSEQIHREIYNSTSEGIAIHEVESGKIIDANRALLKMFGYTYEEFLSLDLEKFSAGYGDYNINKAKGWINKSIQEGPQVVEWHSRKKDGSLFWTEVSVRVVEIKNQQRILAVVRDIDERKKSAEILRRNEEKYRLLIEGQTDLVIKMNTEGNLLFVSPSYCEMFGKSEDELLGKPFSLLVHKDDMYHSHKAMEQLYRPPYTCYIEQRALTKNGCY